MRGGETWPGRGRLKHTRPCLGRPLKHRDLCVDEDMHTCVRVYTHQHTSHTRRHTHPNTPHAHTCMHKYIQVHTRVQPPVGLVKPFHIHGLGRPLLPSCEVTDVGNGPSRAHGGLKRVREGPGRATCGWQSPRGLTGPRTSHWMLTARDNRGNAASSFRRITTPNSSHKRPSAHWRRCPHTPLPVFRDHPNPSTQLLSEQGSRVPPFPRGES